MRNLVSALIVGLAISHSAFAITANLDANAIKHIHGQIVISFSANCKKTLSGNSDAICTCLAGKANDYLDDDALSQCANDDAGMSCVSKLVAGASVKALSKENVAACSQQTTLASQDDNVLPAAGLSQTPSRSSSTATSAPTQEAMNASMSSDDATDVEKSAATTSTPSRTHEKEVKNAVKTENIGSTVDDSDVNDGSY